MSAYIEIVSAVALYGFKLTDFDLWAIGGSCTSAHREFTRENVAAGLDKGLGRFEIGVYGWEDFHAVCGDIDIPWATKEAKTLYDNPSKSPSPYGP